MINDIRGRAVSARRQYNSNSVPAVILDPSLPKGFDAELIPYRNIALGVIKLAVMDAGKRQADAIQFLFRQSSREDLEFWCALLGVSVRHVQDAARMAMREHDQRKAAALPLPTTVGDRRVA